MSRSRILAALLWCLPTLGLAAPQLPTDDAVVLETLPGRPGDARSAELRRLRAEAAASPRDADAAARLARRYFDLATAEGDPRYIGYAEASLRGWPVALPSPAGILVLHGMLRQYRHDFAGAMAAFELALRSDPANTEARAWRAAIRMVQAEYAAARTECAGLAEHASDLQASACIAYVDATTGQARGAYQRLATALARRSSVAADYGVWIQTRLAEMAWRMGEHGAAERHFRAGLALGVDDNFLLAAFADFLLERGRAAEVIPLLAHWQRSDTLLLRLALAARALGRPEAEQYRRALAARFAEAALRGEKLHLQEEARYLLDLAGDARAALSVARENFVTQREPRDALVLLEAALAARDRTAAAPALAWLQESGFEGARLNAVAASLRALKP